MVAALVTGLVMATASFSWFTQNKKVSASGAEMKVEVSKSLVIASSPEEIRDSIYFEYLFAPVSAVLKEATHDWGTGSETGLKFLKNTNDIDPKNGLNKIEEPEYTWVPVESEEEEGSEEEETEEEPLSHYYRDYTFYIASTEESMQLSHLYANMSFAGDPHAHPDYQMATTVDFYLGEVSPAGWRGTLNLAGYDYLNSGYLVESIDLNNAEYPWLNPLIVPYQRQTQIEGEDLPSNCLKVIMRLYFDGGLQKVEDEAVQNQTYIYADNLVLDGYSIVISLSAEELTWD